MYCFNVILNKISFFPFICARQNLLLQCSFYCFCVAINYAVVLSQWKQNCHQHTTIHNTYYLLSICTIGYHRSPTPLHDIIIVPLGCQGGGGGRARSRIMGGDDDNEDDGNDNYITLRQTTTYDETFTMVQQQLQQQQQ